MFKLKSFPIPQYRDGVSKIYNSSTLTLAEKKIYSIFDNVKAAKIYPIYQGPFICNFSDSKKKR